MPPPPSLRPQQVTPVPLAQLAALLGADVAGETDDVLGEAVESPEFLITGVTHDSRQVRPGDLYAALPGALTHGARFAAVAVESGAVAVLTDPDGAERIAAARDESGAGAGSRAPAVPVVVVPEPRQRLGEVAATVYGHPARDLLLLGVTGTNGKTTTAYLLEAGLSAAGHTTGLIGTVEIRVGEQRVPSVRTTPESTDLHALLAVMRERGVTACAMEVSSHALVLGRVDGVVFDVVGFTNLTQDHLDFHDDLDDYFAAKAALFTPARARRGVVCVEDDYGRRLARDATVPVVPVLTDDDEVRVAASPGWNTTATQLTAEGTSKTTLRRGETTVDLQVPLPGRYNVANAALAVAMLAEAGIDPAIAAAGVAACTGVPGRTERVTADGETAAPLALVDYAHTPDAIENVLEALPRRGRVIVVVGAGGDRDPHKRPLMGEAAARSADVVVVTDDNPRSEDPAAIRAAVLAGAAEVPAARRAEVVEVAGRREAIRVALSRARSSADTVAVLGKGHEQGQEIAGVVHPFDDREVLREELRRWREALAR